jgi:hypothetical protein
MPLLNKRKRQIIAIVAKREELKHRNLKQDSEFCYKSDDELLLSPTQSSSSSIQPEIEDDPEDFFVDIDVVDDGYFLSQFSVSTSTSNLSHLRTPVYNSTSYRTLKRRSAMKRELAKSASNTPSIKNFFTPIAAVPIASTSQFPSCPASPSSLCEFSVSSQSDEECDALPPDAAITLIDSITLNKQNSFSTSQSNKSVHFLVKRSTAVRAYLLKWSQEKENFKRISASNKIAQIVYCCSSSNQYRGKIIRYWAQYFLQHGEFPERKIGAHPKITSFILDEDIQHDCRCFIRSLSSKERLGLTQQKFADFVNYNIPTVNISVRTAGRWLHHLGFNCKDSTKGIYIDGHERPDVVEYRRYFCRLLLGLKRRIATITDSNIIPPILQPNEKELVLVVHDECTFAAHDDRKLIWVEDGRPPLRPKGDGHVIMVSQFLCACHGSLTISHEEARALGWDFTTAGEIIYPGKNKDGYWDNQDLVNQLQTKAIPLFNYLHPNKTAIFAFDNSQNHQAMADDALIATRLNLSDGFKASTRKRPMIMRDGYYYDQDDNKIIQSMRNENGEQKGIRRILQERGLWRDQFKLDSAIEILRNEPDFVAQSHMSWLKEVVTSAHHMFIYFPKFHPEFNFIERYWGMAKRYARSKCAYSFKELEAMVPEAILSVSLQTIRRLYNHCWRYIDAYNTDNLQPHQVEWAMKKYTSHRRIKESNPDEQLPGFLTPEFLMDIPPRDSGS